MVTGPAFGKSIIRLLQPTAEGVLD
jgi:hypothetical protein